MHESLWDPGGISHPTITSVREHKGYLYIGGLENNRIGRLPAARRRSDLGRLELLLGSGKQDDSSNNQCLRGQTMSLARDIIDRVFFPNREIHSIPVLDGAFSPNERLDRARQLGESFDTPDALVLGR